MPSISSPITNFSGWTDINSRAVMMYFAYWEGRGKECVLLYCGDHDPGGLHISEFIRSNFADLTGAVGWSPEPLIIERFGLDYDFIVAQGLTRGQCASPRSMTIRRKVLLAAWRDARVSPPGGGRGNRQSHELALKYPAVAAELRAGAAAS
jgi:hypothetical protein